MRVTGSTKNSTGCQAPGKEYVVARKNEKTWSSRQDGKQTTDYKNTETAEKGGMGCRLLRTSLSVQRVIGRLMEGIYQ